MSLKHIFRDSVQDDMRNCIGKIDSLAEELEIRLIRSETLRTIIIQTVHHRMYAVIGLIIRIPGCLSNIKSTIEVNTV